MFQIDALFSVPYFPMPAARGGEGGLSEPPAPAPAHHAVPGCRASDGSAGQLCRARE